MKRNRVLLALAILLVVSCVIAVPIAKNAANRDFLQGKEPVSEENLPQSNGEGVSNEQTSVPNGETSEPNLSERVSFLAAGDIVLHESVFLDANLNAGESGKSGSVNASSKYDFSPMYAKVKSAVSGADLAMVNQETLVAASKNGVPQGYPNFSGPETAGKILLETGFDIVNIGNNHMLDVSSDGLNRSMSFWKSQSNVSMIGAYGNRAECDDFLILDKNGVKIAVLPYLGQTPGTNGNRPDSTLYIPYLDEELVKTQISAAREKADCVIVTVHWGIEGTYSLNSEQKKYTSLFAELGVDVVIGTHPHVLQPMEWVQRNEYTGGGKMLVCYSLGDFLSHTQLAGGKNTLGNLLGGYVTFDIVKCETGALIENVVFTPTVSHYNETSPLDTGFCIYPLDLYTDELVKKFGDPKAGFTSVSQLWKIVRQNIPSEFLSSVGGAS